MLIDLFDRYLTVGYSTSITSGWEPVNLTKALIPWKFNGDGEEEEGNLIGCLPTQNLIFWNLRLIPLRRREDILPTFRLVSITGNTNWAFACGMEL